MHTKLALLVIILICTNGCIDDMFRDPSDLPENEFLQYLEAGFDKTHPRLFWDRLPNENHTRIFALLKYFGHEDFVWFETEITSDRQIRLWNYYHGPTSNVLIISSNEPPKILETPMYEQLDLQNKPIAWRDETCNEAEWIFSNGKKLYLKGSRFDNAGQYFCSGGYCYSDTDKPPQYNPLYIYSAKEPNKPLVQSSLTYPTQKIFTAEDKVVLVGTIPDPKVNIRNTLVEIYLRKGNNLVLEKRFTIKCPRKIGTWRLVPKDFDYKSEQILFKLHRQFFSQPRYLYDIKTEALVELKGKDGCSGYFIDQDMFRKVLAMHRK